MSGAAQRPLRLAMFSPVPPAPSGIAAYLMDLLPHLPQAWHIDLFTDEGIAPDGDALARGRSSPVGCFPHTEFAARNEESAYDLCVYQVGNSREHTYLLDHALEHPGLLVLHDGVLHPARVGAATERADIPGYRRAARACRDDVGNAVGHLVAGGLGGPALYFAYPMCEDLVRASRATAMHGELACGWLLGHVPEASAVSLTHWRSVSFDPAQRDAWRQRLAGAGEVLIGSFGNIGPERRLDRVLQALAGVDTEVAWRMVVAGRVDERLGLRDLADRLGLADRIAWHEGLDDDDFCALMAAVDFAVNLRFPPARSSSGVLHQLLQLGVPALISDVVHWRDYPDAAVARIPPGPDDAENGALHDALGRWIGHPEARVAAAAAAAAWATANLTAQAMGSSYVAAVEEALRQPT